MSLKSLEMAQFLRSCLPILSFVKLLMCSYEKAGWPGYQDLSFCNQDLSNQGEYFPI